MESSSVSVCEAVSSVLCTLQEQRRLVYSRSSIHLVSELENKYPLSDVIMRSYTGNKIEGNLEGHGTVEFKDGHTYEGDFHLGMMHGCGRYVWKDGLVYEGEFHDCTITGVGKYTWPNGSTYTGEVRNGLRHGNGTYWCAETGSTYVGQWVAGRRQGHGRLNYNPPGREESYYDGEWVDNQQKGVGTRKYRSGNVYEGEWHCNERHGSGTMHWYDRGERYTGQWVKGIQYGQGEHMWIIQGSDNAQYPLCNRYDGDWNQGKRNGFGTFYYANGSKYIGEWQQDLKHGRGKFVFQSGQVFEGRFHKDKMVGGGSTGAEEMGLLRPQTPLGSLIGDIDHSDFMTGGSITEKFNFQISRLLSETNAEYELRQIHCVLMQHITQLKKIYHHYSSLGSSPADVGKGGCTLTQMQLWRLLRDCKIHHQGITLYDVDSIIHPDANSSAYTVHDPNHTFLMREFLQFLVYLSHHLISNQQDKRSRVGDLSQKLSTFIISYLLPKACQVGGILYSKPSACIKEAMKYQQDVWKLYQHIQSSNERAVKLRDILLLLKGCGLVMSSFSSRSVVQELIKDNPLAVDDQDYNLEIKVTFLEFFEILLQCAEGWYSKYREQAKEQEVEQQSSVPVVLVTSDAEKAASYEHDITPVQVVISSEGETPQHEQESPDVLSDHQGLEQHTSEQGEESDEIDGTANKGSPESGQEEVRDGKDVGKQMTEEVLSGADADAESDWKELLHAFFEGHLLAKLQH